MHIHATWNRPLAAFVVTICSLIPAGYAQCSCNDGYLPQIITYGDPCSPGCESQFPITIQTPVNEQPGSPDSLPVIPGGAEYPVRCEITPQELPPLVGSQFSALIQSPLIPRKSAPASVIPDPLQGRRYGIGLDVPPPSRIFLAGRAFDAGIQTAGPAAPASAPLRPNYAVRVHVPSSGPTLGLPNLSAAVESPVITRPASSSPPEYKRLQGLSPRIDTLLIPACEFTTLTGIPTNGVPYPCNEPDQASPSASPYDGCINLPLSSNPAAIAPIGLGPPPCGA